jgi:predicted metal-dependent HD superfamily phosphohydrolase
MSGVNGETLLLLETAALYHDTGFLLQYGDHETASIAIARETLPDFGYTHAQIELIVGLIGATRMPQRPRTPLQELICDADLDLIGREDFVRLNHELHKEVSVYSGRDISEYEWLIDQLKFLEDHHFFTRAALATRSEGKAQNLAHMRQSLERMRVKG